MSEDKRHYLSQDKKAQLEQEFKQIKEEKIPFIARRIDEAKQMGDLSENAEYHSAREDMAWAQGRANEIQHILDNAEMISGNSVSTGSVIISSAVRVKVNGLEREFTIVGPQEAEPLKGKISNESPLGEAFLGKKVGDRVVISVPAGKQEYEILEIK